MNNNLDILCAKYSQKLSDDSGIEEDLLQKALGVLQENGLFAFVVYLESEKDTKIKEISEELLEKIDVISEDHDDFKNKIMEITEDIDKTILTKTLLEQMLIYARYQVKARGD